MELFNDTTTAKPKIEDLAQLLRLIAWRVESLVSLVDEDGARKIIHELIHTEEPVCPRCQARLGKTARFNFNAGRRCRCLGCGSEINDRSGTPLQQIHLTNAQVVTLAVLIGLLEGATTPSQSAASLAGVSVTTLFNWRDKFLEGLK